MTVPVFSTGQPVPNSFMLSHTYIITTNPDGSLEHTFSWGNTYINGIGQWHMDSMKDDWAAAEIALKNPKKYELIRVGDEVTDMYVLALFMLWESDPNHPSKHTWELDANCKNEAVRLGKEAIKLRSQYRAPMTFDTIDTEYYWQPYGDKKP